VEGFSVTNIGIIGCGFISEVYLKNLQDVFENTDVVVVSDRDLDRAKARADAFNVPRVAPSNAALLDDPEVEIVVNLTVPTQHFEVSRAALLAGKHVYTEKPLALSLEQGQELCELARQRELCIASAPDTFLGGAVQTAKHLIETGWIGEPFGFFGHLFWGGAAAWHPEPEFLYREGGGPILDNAPYPIAALVHLLGSVSKVAAFSSRPFAERVIGSGPRAGTRFPVEVDTFATVILELQNGASGSLGFSFDIPHSRADDPRQNGSGIEIYGTRGTVSIPSPGFYGGDLMFRGIDGEEWSTVPHLYPYRTDSRGIGVADLAAAIVDKRRPRLDIETTYHSHEVLMGMVRATQWGGVVEVASRAAEPRGLPLGVGEGRVG
jgi:predicted dehydrogenase